MANLDPPAAFSFQVRFDDLGGTVQAQFHEVSGLETGQDIEGVAEGGENRVASRLPGAATLPNLVMKRGVIEPASALLGWCQETLAGDLTSPIAPRTVLVSLTDQNGTVHITWTLTSAWPVQWAIADLAVTTSETAVERLEFAYQTIARSSNLPTPPPPPAPT